MDKMENNIKKKLYNSTLIFCVLIIVSSVFAQDSQKIEFFDGPHIFYEKDSLLIKYYDNGPVKTYKIWKDTITKFQGFLKDSTKIYIVPQQFESPPDKYSNVEKIFVVSDIHGHYNIFEDLLRGNNVIDQNNSWIWGNGHLIIVGDVFDKGTQVHEVLWLIYSLEQQAKEQGGTIHFLLGNHDVKALRGDLKYVKENYFTIAESFSITVPEFYLENTFWGRWLRSKNILTQINSLLFVHGGIHPETIEKYNFITDINEIMKANIDLTVEQIKMDSTLLFLFRKDGPIRYRGYFRPDSLPDTTGDELTKILNHFNVEKIIVGHTIGDHIDASYNNRIICVDCGIMYGLHGEGLLISDGRYYRVDTNGVQKLLIQEKP